MKRMMNKTKRRAPAPRKCPFCINKVEPDFKDIDGLRRYISDRGKIIGSMHTGICKKHQSRVAKAIKRARYLALLPFIVRPV
jgi:small subunit ribosomal protein S18